MLERALAFEVAAAARPALPILPLEAKGLVFEAAGRRLIDGLDLLLRPGLLTVVMGPNGAGKSLLLRLLHGLLRPHAGSVLWAGRLIGPSAGGRRWCFKGPCCFGARRSATFGTRSRRAAWHTASGTSGRARCSKSRGSPRLRGCRRGGSRAASSNAWPLPARSPSSPRSCSSMSR